MLRGRHQLNYLRLVKPQRFPSATSGANRRHRRRAADFAPPASPYLVVTLNGDGTEDRARQAAVRVVAALLPYAAGKEGKRYLRLDAGRKVWLEELFTA
jgi:hypothetical protein